MLELCWSLQPNNHPTIEAVLECLEQVSTLWQPPPPNTDGGVETDTDDESPSTMSSLSMFLNSFLNPRLTFKGKVSRSVVAAPSAMNPVTQRSSDMLTVETVDASGVSSPSQPLEKLDLEDSAGIVNRVGWLSFLSRI